MTNTNEPKKCSCGRSPTGNCVGWHALSEDEYRRKKEDHEKKKQAEESGQ